MTSAAPSSETLFTRQTGRAPFHFVLMPGLVPDGPETFHRHLKLFRSLGTVSVATYPYTHFKLDPIIEAIGAEVNAARARGRLVILVAVSVGGGLVLELLRRCRDRGAGLRLSGLILCSPLTCTDDLAPLLKRLIDPICNECERDDGDPLKALERGRAFFKSLAGRTSDRTLPAPWKSAFALLTPAGWQARGETQLRRRIQTTLDAIPQGGAVERVSSLRRLGGLETDKRAKPLSKVPTLILWGSKERHTLSMEGPGTSLLCRPDLACKVFPNVEVHWLYGRDGEEVPHASLLKHADAFHAHFARFALRLRDQARQRKRAVRRMALKRMFRKSGLLGGEPAREESEQRPQDAIQAAAAAASEAVENQPQRARA
jgi:pimeloyl-ACP methyl ester carboxylesterase